jgi:acyl carrier protein
MSDPEIAAQVIPYIAEVTGFEPQEITLEQTFFGDLGGESIDYLDLGFRLEKHFGTKIPVQKLESMSDIAVEGGRVTPEGLETMRQNYPFLDVASFEREPRAGSLSNLVTVEAIVRMVEHYLAQAQADAS